LVVSVFGDTATFEPLVSHGTYLDGNTGSNELVALYYPKSRTFFVELHFINPTNDQDSYTTHILSRASGGSPTDGR
jgi:hypothetical protein